MTSAYLDVRVPYPDNWSVQPFAPQPDGAYYKARVTTYVRGFLGIRRYYYWEATISLYDLQANNGAAHLTHLVDVKYEVMFATMQDKIERDRTEPRLRFREAWRDLKRWYAVKRYAA